MKEEVFYSAKHDMLFVVYFMPNISYYLLNAESVHHGWQNLELVLQAYGPLDYIGDL